MGRLSSISLIGLGVLAGIAATLAWSHQRPSQVAPETIDTAQREDDRTAIAFTIEEREHISSEMLAFL
jgi:hypothetical protein